VGVQRQLPQQRQQHAVACIVGLDLPTFFQVEKKTQCCKIIQYLHN